MSEHTPGPWEWNLAAGVGTVGDPHVRVCDVWNQKEMDHASNPSGTGTQQQAQIRQEAQVIGMGMELWSITATPKGMCCMIDDKVLYQGDTYRNMTVKSIAKKVVTLEYKGIDVELKMD